MMIYDIIETLRSDNSRLFKESVLLKEKDNILLKKTIEAALNPLKQYYIRKIPKYEKADDPTYIAYSLDMAIEQLDYLSSRAKTGNSGIEHLKKILESTNPKDAEVIELIIGKDLKCGASTSTVNKIWPKLVPEFPVMLASGYSEKLVKSIKMPAIVQLKSDGLRCMAIVNNGEVDMFSRNGKPIFTSESIKSELLKICPAGESWVFDGELMVWNYAFSSFVSRKVGNGLINHATKGEATEEELSKICFMIWDMIPLSEFNKGEYKVPYETRFDKLRTLLSTNTSTVLSLIESTVIDSLDDADKIFKEYLEHGLEGIILKDSNGIWEDKRSKGLIKFKNELNTSLRCTAVDYGKGKYEGLIGALQCESEDGLLTVGVGTGLTDDDRKKSHDYYLGKIISLKYNEKIQSKDGTWSLFLPVYEEVRFDQDSADSLKEIK